MLDIVSNLSACPFCNETASVPWHLLLCSEATHPRLRQDCDAGRPTRLMIAAGASPENVTSVLAAVTDFPDELGCADAAGRTALVIAIESGNHHVAKLLYPIEHRIVTPFGATPLMLAAGAGLLPEVQRLLTTAPAPAALLAADTRGRTALHYLALGRASDAGVATIARVLTPALAARADTRGRTALHYAVVAGRPDLAEILLLWEAGLVSDGGSAAALALTHIALVLRAPVPRDVSGIVECIKIITENALYFTMERPDVSLQCWQPPKVLLGLFDPSAVARQNGPDPALRRGIETAKTLSESKRIKFITDTLTSAPFTVPAPLLPAVAAAAAAAWPRMPRPSPPAADFSPLMIAAASGNHDVVSHLLRTSGAPLELVTQTTRGITALQFGAVSGDYRVVDDVLHTCLVNGAAPRACAFRRAAGDAHALTTAARHGDLPLVALLAPHELPRALSRGADPALAGAAAEGHVDIVRLLLCSEDSIVSLGCTCGRCTSYTPGESRPATPTSPGPTAPASPQVSSPDNASDNLPETLSPFAAPAALAPDHFIRRRRSFASHSHSRTYSVDGLFNYSVQSLAAPPPAAVRELALLAVAGTTHATAPAIVQLLIDTDRQRAVVPDGLPCPLGAPLDAPECSESCRVALDSAVRNGTPEVVGIIARELVKDTAALTTIVRAGVQYQKTSAVAALLAEHPSQAIAAAAAETAVEYDCIDGLMLALPLLPASDLPNLAHSAAMAAALPALAAIATYKVTDAIDTAEATADEVEHGVCPAHAAAALAGAAVLDPSLMLCRALATQGAETFEGAPRAVQADAAVARAWCRATFARGGRDGTPAVTVLAAQHGWRMYAETVLGKYLPDHSFRLFDTLEATDGPIATATNDFIDYVSEIAQTDAQRATLVRALARAVFTTTAPSAHVASVLADLARPSDLMPTAPAAHVVLAALAATDSPALARMPHTTLADATLLSTPGPTGLRPLTLATTRAAPAAVRTLTTAAVAVSTEFAMAEARAALAEMPAENNNSSAVAICETLLRAAGGIGDASTYPLLHICARLDCGRAANLLLTGAPDVYTPQLRRPAGHNSTPVHAAVAAGSADALRVLASFDVDVALQCDCTVAPSRTEISLVSMLVRTGRAPLTLCARSGRADLIEALLKVTPATAVAGARERDGTAAIHHAAFYGHANVVSLLMPLQGVARCPAGCSVLSYAAAAGADTVLTYLVRQIHRYEGLKETDRAGRTPLHAAALGAASPESAELLAPFFDVDERDDANETAADIALRRGATAFADICRELAGVKDGATPRGRESRAADRALRACTEGSGDVEGLRALLSAGGMYSGAALRRRGENGRTMLMHAACTGNIELCKYILCSAPDLLGKVDDDGSPALTIAIARLGGRAAFLVKLLADEAGIVNKAGKTAVDLALAGGLPVRPVLLELQSAAPKLVADKMREGGIVA